MTAAPDPLTVLFADLDAWAAERPLPARTVRYGNDPSQELDLRLPAGSGPHPVALVLHGGFWRAPYERGIMTACSVALTGAGWATANVEYRRLGPGAYEPMLADVAHARAALDGLDEPLDRAAVVAVGHSAGGHLALWLAAEGRVAGAVGLGAVADLEEAARLGLGRDAVQELLGGGPAELPAAYDRADPGRRLPLGVPQLLVHGTDDEPVPLALARHYAAKAVAAGDDCRLLELEGADHFDVIDPRSRAWPAIERAAAELLARLR